MTGSGYRKSPVQGLMEKLLSGPHMPESVFSFPECTYDELYRTACYLSDALGEEPDPEKPICLFSDNHAVIAATLLATLGKGPPVIFPHSLSRKALVQLHKATGFHTMVSENKDVALENLRIVDPNNGVGKTGTPDLGCGIDKDHTWVYLSTGGTTGTSKLWPKTPENLLGEAGYIAKRYGYQPHDRVLATTPPYHIYGLLYSILAPLLAGCSVVGRTPSFPGEIRSTIKEEKATLLVSMPAHYRGMISNMKKTDDLRLAFSASSPLSIADDEAFVLKSGVDIIEIYGSTETGGIATRCRTKGEKAMRPYDCIRWKFKGDHLMIQSDFVSPTFLERQDRFCKAPDRISPKGKDAFVVKGRLDSVVKVAGKRVDLEDLKRVILNEDGVTNVSLMARPVHTGRENEILALVEGDVEKEDLMVSLAKRIEHYAMPRAIKLVPHIPVTATGKIDRKKMATYFDNHLT